MGRSLRPDVAGVAGEDLEVYRYIYIYMQYMDNLSLEEISRPPDHPQGLEEVFTMCQAIPVCVCFIVLREANVVT